MKVGLQIPSFTWLGGAAALGKRLGEIARTADDAGFASLWAALSFLAAHTRRARLGTMVTEKKTLRLVARHADACNLFEFLGADGIAKKLEVLRRHCDAEKRDYAAAGVQNAIFNMPDAHALAPLKTFGKEIVPAVAEL